MDSKQHTELFSKAAKKFSAGDYKTARSLFEDAAKGPVLSVNESAAMYIRMCDQRIRKATPELKSAEDYYNYGVGLINARRTADAIHALEKAAALEDSSHILYALALANGLHGDLPSSAASLRRAIQLDPSTRGLARSDPDFQPLLQHHEIREALSGDRHPSQ
jgi:tetratricopeptide (TPR) repeat protein